MSNAMSSKSELHYSPRLRPVKAFKHFQKLIENKEDTAQVFHIVEALTGNSFPKNFAKFVSTEKGRARFEARKYLPPLLDDHEPLRALPEGTVGRAYVEFMESQNLTAAGLVAEYDDFNANKAEIPEELQWYSNRLRDTHDLFHVLTGYSRDALGEASVLGFSYSQNRNMGTLFIAVMAGWEVRKSAPKGAPVMGSVFEAKRNGKLAQSIASEDIMALMEEPLEAARARLGIQPCTKYNEVHKRIREAGMDPYEMITPVAVAA